MSNEWAPAPPPRPPRKWPKRLLWMGAGCLVLSLIGYFILTSSLFFESIVLPRLNEIVHAEITVSSARISPFSRITFEDLELRTTRLDEPILKAREVTARYSLWSILGGTIRVHDVLLDSPTIQVIEFADGRRNIDPLLAGAPAGQSPPPEPDTPAEKSSPPRVDVARFLLTNATVRVVRHLAGGGRDVVTLSGGNVGLTNLINGGVAGLDMGASLRLDHVPAIGVTNDTATSLRLVMTGKFQCWMDDALQLEAVKGQAILDVPEVTGAFPELANLRATLDAEFSMSRIAGIQLAFQQDGADLGSMRLHGPLSVARQEGGARLEISGIDRRALNLAGAALGLDFGSTTLNATNDLQLSLNGQVVSLKGNVRAGQLGVTADGKTTVPLDLDLGYEVNVDQPAQTAVVKTFSLTGDQTGVRVLQGTLSQPMKLSWSESGRPLDQSAFDLVVTNFNLADWKAFLGECEGLVSTTLRLDAAQGGNRLDLNVTSGVRGLSVRLGTNQLDKVNVEWSVQTQVENFQLVRLKECRLGVLRDSRRAVTVDVSGTCDLKQQEIDLQSLVHVALPEVTALLDDPELSSSSGELRVITSLRQKNLTPGQTNSAHLDQAVTGEIRLVDFTGRQGEWTFQALESKTDFQAGLKDGEARLTQWETTLQQNGQPGGVLKLSGIYAMTSQVASVSVELTDLNEHILQSFLPTSTNGPLLQAVRLGGKADLRHDPGGASLVHAAFAMTDLLLPGPKPGSSANPISMTMDLSAALENGVAQLREFKGSFLGGAHPAGQMSATGQYDVSNRTGRLSFHLEDLDQEFLGPLTSRSLGEKSLSNAVVRLELNATYDAARESVVGGEVRLHNWVIHDPAGALPRQPLEVSCTWEGGLRDDEARLSIDSGNVRLGGLLGGQFSLGGTYHLKTGAGKGELALTDFNEKLLGPFAAASLDGKELASVTLETDLTANFVPEGESRLSGSIKASNFLIRDPSTNIGLKPLSGELDLNVGMNQQIVSLDSIRVGLSPTVRARDEMTVTGRLDLTDTNAMGGNLKIVGESIDLTPYYDFFVAQPSPPAPTEGDADDKTLKKDKPPADQPAPSRQPPAEPAPVTLPFRDFVIDAEIGRFFLREIQIADWKTKARLDGSHVTVKPLAMTVNEAPLRFDTELDLSVPGYRYDVMISADRIPVEPLANTLMPQTHGQYKGDLLANVQIKGAGVTGANLRSNLTGKFGFSLTNAVVRIHQGSAKAFLLPIAVMLQSPDLMKSPLNWIGADVSMGEGKIRLEQAGAVSPLFAGGTKGVINIEDDIMKSSLKDFPVTFCLQRELARQARLLPRGIPKEDTYVLVPDFITAVGTLGEPASKLDKLALSGSVLKKAISPVTGGEQPVSSSNPFELLRRP